MLSSSRLPWSVCSFPTSDWSKRQMINLIARIMSTRPNASATICLLHQRGESSPIAGTTCPIVMALGYRFIDMLKDPEARLALSPHAGRPSMRRTSSLDAQTRRCQRSSCGRGYYAFAAGIGEVAAISTHFSAFWADILPMISRVRWAKERCLLYLAGRVGVGVWWSRRSCSPPDPPSGSPGQVPGEPPSPQGGRKRCAWWRGQFWEGRIRKS